MLVALELQDSIDDVFQNLRTGYASFLINMSNQNDWRVCLLGKFENGGRTFAHLYQASGRRINRLGRYRLYGVDDNQVGPRIFDVHINLFQRCFACYQTVRGVMADAVGTQLQLPCAFFAGNIQYLLFGQPQNGLQHKGGLSDSRFSAQQDQRSGNQTAAQHTVQLLIVHIDARFVATRYFAEDDRLALDRFQPRHRTGAGCRLAHHFFYIRVPLTARRAFANPFGRVLSAVATYIYSLFFHTAKVWKYFFISFPNSQICFLLSLHRFAHLPDNIRRPRQYTCGTSSARSLFHHLR